MKPLIVKHSEKILFLCLLLLLLQIVYTNCDAQSRRRKGTRYSAYGKPSPGFFKVGFESSLGTPTFKFNSNIPYIDGQKVEPEGYHAGALIGIKGIDVRLRRGSYNSAPTLDEKVKLVATEGVVNLFPFQILPSKTRFVEPYILGGLGQDVIKLWGAYEIEPKKEVVPPAAHHCHTGPPGDPGMGDPDKAPAPTPAPTVAQDAMNDTYIPTEEVKSLGEITVSRRTIGAGIVIHILGKSSFLDFFAEYRLGYATNTITGERLFVNTKVSRQDAVMVGLALGLKKKNRNRF